MRARNRRPHWMLEAPPHAIRTEVRQARDTMLAPRDLAQFYQKIYLPQRLRIVNETVLQYNAMQKGTFDLISAKERELTAEREYAEAWRDYWIARAELEKALGGGLSGANPPAASNGERAKQPATDKHEHHHK